MVKKVIKMILRQFGLQLVQIHNNKVDQSPNKTQSISHK